MGCLENLFISDKSIEKRFRYNIDPITINRIILFDCNSYKHFRISSTSYANRKFVKQFIFDKFKGICSICGSDKELCIDHIISVKKCYENRNFMACNSLDNLQLLCFTCNNKKSDK